MQITNGGSILLMRCTVHLINKIARKSKYEILVFLTIPEKRRKLLHESLPEGFAMITAIMTFWHKRLSMEDPDNEVQPAGQEEAAIVELASQRH